VRFHKVQSVQVTRSLVGQTTLPDRAVKKKKKKLIQMGFFPVESQWYKSSTIETINDDFLLDEVKAKLVEIPY